MKYAKKIFAIAMVLMMLLSMYPDVNYATDRETLNNMLTKLNIDEDDFREFNGHTYLLITDALKPTEAELLCQYMDGHLVTITSQEENDFLKGLFEENHQEGYILGGTDRDSEGQWQWMTGEEWTFSDWNSPPEPNDGLGRGEDYVFASKHNGWRWVDFFGGWDNYSSKFAYVCEWDTIINSGAKTINELMASGMWQEKGGNGCISEFKVNGNQVTSKYYSSNGKYRGDFTGTISGNVCTGYWRSSSGESGKTVFAYEGGVFKGTAFHSNGEFAYETELLPYTGSVEGGPEAVVTGANLLKNPSFEDGLQHWVNPTGDWVSSPKADNNDSHKAVHGANLIWAERSRSKDTYVYQDVSLEGLATGKKLSLSVQTSNWPQSPRDRSKIVLNFLDASGNILKTCSNENEGDTWYKLDVSEAVPAGAVKVRVELWGMYHNGVVVDAYYDNVVLTASDLLSDNNNNNNSNNNNNNNNNNTAAPAPDKAVPVDVTGGKDAKTTFVFNGVTGVTVSFKHRGVIGYRLYRSTNPDDLGISVTDFYITANHFTDVNVEPDTTYYYSLQEVLAEADPLSGKREELGDIVATWTVTTARIVGQNFTDSSKTRHFIMLKIDEPFMSVDGEAKEVDPGRGTKPIVVNGRTMVPIRAIVESMGGSVGWQASDSRVSLGVNGIDVKMWVGKKELSNNNVMSSMDIAPTVINGRTFVPLRFGAENLNCRVDWINSTRSIVIVWSE